MNEREPAPTSGAERQAQQLIGEIDAATAAEAAALLAAAQQDARAILADAHRVARARMGELVPRLRQERAAALAQQQARIEVEARRSEQVQAARLVAAGRRRLRQSLVARWSDPAARRQWLDAALTVAGRFLRRGNWLVEAAPGLSDEERGYLSQQADIDYASRLDWRQGETLDAGLRIVSEGAVLDATPAGLMANGHEIDAALLAELGRRRQKGATA